MRNGLRARTIAASALLALLIAGAFALLIFEIRALREAAALSRRAEVVASTANHLERLTIDVSAGQRGYVITRDRSFLEPWALAREEIPREQAKLLALIDDPAQRERALDLQAEVNAFLNDFAEPLVETATRDPEEARAIVARGEGKQLLDSIRARFDRFLEEEQALSTRREAAAATEARRAIGLASVGLGGSLLLIFLFGAYISRAVVRPVRRVSESAVRLARGDLSARVPAGGAGEVRELGDAFNTMAEALQEGRDELESQNAELELQTAELEDQQSQLAAKNEELAARRTELERAVEEATDEKRRIDTFYSFGETVAAETDLDVLSEDVLAALAEFARAEVGTLYLTDENAGPPVLLAARGLDRETLPHELQAAVGLAGRAFSEARVLTASHAEGALQLTSFGEVVHVQEELHVPLVHAEGTLGVVTLGRVAPRPFEQRDLDAFDHLGQQAAVALANALSFRRVGSLVTVNRSVLDASLDGIRLVDPEGRTVLANAAMERMANDLLRLPDDGTIYDRVQALAERTVDPAAYRAAMDVIQNDPDFEGLHEYQFADTGRWVQRYTAPVRDAEGDLIGRIFVLREVTAERQAERMKSELVATVSHELRTPLASVLGFAELLVERDLEPDVRQRYLTTIHNEAKRLTGLINDFLDLQRIEEGKFTLAIEPFELEELLQEELELSRGHSRRHTIELDVADAASAVAGDRERIRQVVGNLISNAIKYSPQGGAVRVASDVVEGAVRVSVTDSGLGIPQSQQQEIFTKFFRVDSSDTREIGGTGLGLALCKEIVEAHGGRIGFESVEGAGSTFWFELPARDTSGGSANGRPRILVVEDDRAAASLLCEHLESDGYAVVKVSSGEEALRRIEEELPDAVCLDIGLPGELDGWQVLARLKDSDRTAHVPVVICTAGNGRDNAAALGAADFLTKPFTGRQLRETVARLLPERGGSLLVVDDDESIRRLVLATLAPEGFDLREASDGEEALAAVRAQKPDAIVLDLMMPTMDGFSVLERLAEDASTRSIPVVVLTAKKLSEAERRKLCERASSLLEKSDYSGSELRLLVRQALERRGAAELV